MLKSYPPSEGIEIGGYVGMLAATLLQYPKCVAVRCADPIKGVVSTTRFKPTVADLTAWCEREMAGLRTIVDRDDSEKKMLADRKMALEGEREMAEARKRRPNLEDLRKKHGQNWGIRSMGGDLSRDETAPLAPRAAVDQAAAERKILAEYARVGKEPFRAGNLLISPSLVAALKGHGGNS